MAAAAGITSIAPNIRRFQQRCEAVPQTGFAYFKEAALRRSPANRGASYEAIAVAWTKWLYDSRVGEIFPGDSYIPFEQLYLRALIVRSLTRLVLSRSFSEHPTCGLPTHPCSGTGRLNLGGGGLSRQPMSTMACLHAVLLGTGAAAVPGR